MHGSMNITKKNINLSCNKNVQMQRAMAVRMADIWVAVNRVDLGVYSCVSLINSASEVLSLSS